LSIDYPPPENIENNLAKSISTKPKIIPINVDKTITSTVNLVASCRVGQETFFNSEKTSEKNLNREKPEDLDIPGPEELLTVFLAKLYLFSLNTWTFLQVGEGQNFFNSILSGVFLLFFSV
tara:strand:- start:623 stop:985 length:363 start_codon:yes stop_codon:yes gene_type:complete